VIIGEVTMAAVLTFYQLPDEEETFLDYVESTGKIIAVPFEIARTRSDFTPLPLRECLNRFNPNKVAFGLEEHSELIKIGAYFDKQGEYFTVSLMTSPLISYTRSRWRAPQQLGMSNLAAYWSYPNESATAMLDHPGEFIKWAKKIFRKGREIAPRWPEHESLRMTPLVAAAIREGVKLVS
jgi:hypothetical protein